MLSFSQLVQCTNGTVLQEQYQAPVYYLLTDSRKVVAPAFSLFFAISGERHDGHCFIAELYQRGVRLFVVEEVAKVSIRELKEATIIKVESSIQALQQIASFHRKQFGLPVIGITGSNGKTIVKEWLATLLDKEYKIIKSPKSYNSQIGVPLSVWQINEAHTLGIFEAGISKVGEMERLEEVIRPTAGVFTNIGTAHDEGFNNLTQKIGEKLQLFRHCSAVVYGKDHVEIHAQIESFLKIEQQKITWSLKSADATVYALQVNKSVSATELQLFYSGQDFSLTIPFSDDASIENAMHCITLMLYLGISFEEIQNRLRLLQPVSMRLELKEGVNGCYLIDDTYNNDLAGLTIALDFLHQQKQRPSKTLILSDLLESGMEEAKLYAQISRLIESKGINRLIGVGEEISRNKHYFKLPSEFFKETSAFLQTIPTFSNELILVKGARKFQFEQIVQKLLRKTHGTRLEINLDALSHNLNYFRSLLDSRTKIMVMVKAFAYGSGSAEVANLLQFHRVDYLAVAYADEGVTLRENGIHLPIMVMNPSIETFDTLLAYRLEPELYSPQLFTDFLQYLKESEQFSKVHLKLDTGMHRLGFERADLPELIAQLKTTDRVTVASIFSHLAASDEDIHTGFTHEQMGQFQEMASALENVLPYKPPQHILNSAGIARFTNYQLDMVRLGIGLYGIGVNTSEQAKLESVSTLKTTISQIKHVKVSETVGYGRKGKIEKDTTIATIAIGYADGFDRKFSNGVGKVVVNGKLAPVIGNVCMDMTMIDITGIPAQEGDDVIVFGKEWPITQMAQQLGTIPYEILTSVSERVKRVFYTE